MNIGYIKIVVLLGTIFVLPGCAGSGAGGLGIVQTLNPVTVSAAHQEKVTTDMVAALIQIPATAPFYTTVQFSKPKDPFGKMLIDAMSVSGYGIQMVDADQGNNYVSYRVSRVGNQNEGNVLYTIRINQMEISRQYQILDTQIYPVSELIVKGTEPSKIIVNNDLFIFQGGSKVFPSGVTFLRSDGNVASTEIAAVTARRTNSNDGNAYLAAKALLLAKAATFTLSRMNSEGLGSSNLTKFRTIKHVSLRFRYKSLDLGMPNKTALNSLVDQFDPELHIFLVTGCSHGKSLIWDGTESISLSRSQRVKEELLVNGIVSDSIREAGCFQYEYDDELLPNSVIVTLKERVSLI